jgi:hypothetical protein
VDSKAIRTVVIMGLFSVFALTLLMMFSLDQMADSTTPQIAADISGELQRSLAAEPPANVRLTMVREGKGLDAPRLYHLRLRPNAAVASDERALSRLMMRASQLCAASLADFKAEAKIHCVAELPQGGEREATYRRERSQDPNGLAMVIPMETTAPAKSPPPAEKPPR